MPNKAQFIDQLAERLDGDRRRAAAALDAVIDSVYAAIARGEEVAISGFGKFERRERAARTARNPATGATVQVPASRVPAFRPGTEFKEIASGAREFTAARTARAQAAVSRAAEAVREAPAKAAAAVQDAVDVVREAPAKAAAVVSNSAPAKAARKAAKKAAPATKKAAAKKLASKKTAPATKKTAAKKLATKKTAAKKAAKKTARR